MTVYNPLPGVTYGTATIDFGASPGLNEATVTVTGQSGILSTSNCFAFIMADDTSTEHSALDHRYFQVFANLTCGTPTLDSGFTIHATSSEKLTGTWTVRFGWSN